MYKIGIALMAVFAVMVIPAQISADDGRPTYYGMGTLVLKDAFGNPVFSQTIHNQVVNTGETFIIDQTFQDGTASLAENNSIGNICVTEAASFAASETEAVAAFDSATTIGTGLECKEDTAVDDSTQGTAVIGPLTFTTSNLDAAGEIITGIGICQATVANDSDQATCAAGGILFAEVNTTDVTLNTGETVQITYTFDITSGSS
jgi:hypothetical protein